MSYRGLREPLTPLQFEEHVRELLMIGGCGRLADFRTTHREKLPGQDGDYEIDVTARFRALEVDFLVLVECKHQRSPVKRDIVQILHDRVRSTGAHKGMIFATARFQSGAIEYAQAHGIALVVLTNSEATFLSRSDGDDPRRPPSPWDDPPEPAGWFMSIEDGKETMSLVDARRPERLRTFLEL